MLVQLVRSYGSTRSILFLAAMLVSIGVGASWLIFPSVYAPVIIGSFPFILGILAFWFYRPDLGLYSTLIVVFLPLGLIPLTWQSYLNRILTIAAFVFWFLDIVLRHKKILWRSAHSFFVGYLAWCLITIFWSFNLNNSQTTIQVYSLRFLLFFLVLFNQIRSEKDLNRLMMVLAVIGWMHVIVGITTAVVTGYTPGTRLQVLEDNSNSLGITLLVALPGILWKTIWSGKRRISIHHFLAVVYFVLAIVLIAISGSRGSAISFIVTLLALLFFRRTRAWALICSLILLLAAVFSPFIFNTTIQRFLGESGETVLGGREQIWRAGMELITDNLWSGVGIGNSSYAVMSYLKTYSSVTEFSRSSLHNPLLVILADTGIPGFILYLGFIVSVVWFALRNYSFHRGQGLSGVYLSLVLAIFLGYMASWIKGGGMETGHNYFLMLVLLLIPANLDFAAGHQKQQVRT